MDDNRFHWSSEAYFLIADNFGQMCQHLHLQQLFLLPRRVAADFTNEPFRPTTVNPAVWFFTSMPIVTSACSGVASTKGQKLFVSNTLFKATLRRYPVKRLRWLSLTS